MAAARESDHVEMALMAVSEFEKITDLFAKAGLNKYQQLAEQRTGQSKELVKLLEV